MDISQLRYFLKVAERQSFTHAGEELLVSQSALSRSIAKLEQEIGQPVFERQSRHLVLTDAGRMLKVRAEQILSLVEDTLAEITDDGETGRIRVGAIPTIAPFFLPAVMREFRNRFPKATLIVFEETTDKLLQRCHQGDVDVALLAAPIPKQHLTVEPLFEEELLLVLPEGHPLVDRKTVTVADIDRYPFVLLDETHCLSDNIVSYCRHRSFQPVSVERTSQLATVQELVTLGHGISLIPRMARAVDTSHRRTYRSLSAPKPTRTVVLVWNPYRFQSRITERFKECVCELAPQFGDVPASSARRARR